MRSSLLIASGCAVLVSIAGCAASRPEAALPEPRPLGRELSIPAGSAFQSENVTPPDGASALPDSVSLRDVLVLALQHNPDLAVYAWEIRARDAAALQAGLFPNPTLSTERENFGGSLAADGADRTQTTTQLTVPLELGGQRGGRKRVALLTRDLSGWDYEAARLDVVAETLRRAADLHGAQEHLELASQAKGTAQQMLETVAARADAGKVSPVEVTRARVVVATAEIERARAVQELGAARARLAALWGQLPVNGGIPSFQIDLGESETVPPPDLNALASQLPLNPDLARRDTEVAQREAQLSHERRSRIPTIALGGGYRRFEGTGDHAFVGTLGLTLPLFNRNQGAVRAARFGLSRSEAERRSTETRLHAELAAAHSRLEASYSEMITLQNEVVPAAERTFRDIEEGYRLGKFGFLDVLDAQRTLAELRLQLVGARVHYYHAAADVERLTAAPLLSRF